MPQKNKPRETEKDRKLLAWLEYNGPWMMHMDSTRIMACVGLNLKYGDTISRSIDDSLAAARAELRREYEDARSGTKAVAGTGNGTGGTTGNGNGGRSKAT